MSHKRPRFFPRTDQLSVITATIGLGYVLSRFMFLPDRTVETMLFGSPISVHVDGQAILIILLAALITNGTDVLIRSHPSFRLEPLNLHPLSHWIMPALTTLTAGVILNSIPEQSLWLLGMIVGVSILVIVLVIEYSVIEPEMSLISRLQIGYTLLSYLVALVGFVWVAQLGVRSAISGTSILLIGGLISFRLLLLHGSDSAEAGWNSLVVGLILAELMWALGYWALPPMLVGSWLLIVLHLSVGIICMGRKRVTFGRAVREHAIVAFVAFAISALLLL